ncbi:probable inactive protein kinase DDB_G0270444 isoform X1 [Anolis sagrei]|uniref:probable inactive protein kinase DDB_G0270444 isoform X1 n=1 Tax=Anolis sagrei TaxID=38937 RepID=UPI0035204017
MGPKKVFTKKKRMMCLDTKHEIIEKHEQGVRVADLARQYDRNTSTICSILKQKESIKAVAPAKGIKIISKLRTSAHEEMEKLLLVWLTEKRLAGDFVTESIICEKARALYGDLVRRTPRTSTGEAPEESFKASRGWFDNFKKRTGIFSDVAWQGVARRNLNFAWKKLWPEVVSDERSFEGFKPEELAMEEIVSNGKSSEVDEGDTNGLVEQHNEEPIKEEVEEFQEQQLVEVKQEIDAEEPETEEVWLTVSPKKVCAKKKRMMCLDTKHEIIEKHEQGVRVADLAREYNRNTSTICSILKQKESIKAVAPAKGIKIISKLRTSAHEEMEKLLLVWLTEKRLAGDIVTESIICEKARALYGDLVPRTPGTSTNGAPEESFKASRGWFDNFKKRTGIHSDITRRNVNSSSNKPCPEVVPDERGFEGFKPEALSMDDVVSNGKSMEVDEGDVNNNLVEQHNEEPMMEEFKEHQHMEIKQEIDAEETDTEEEVIRTSEITEMLGMWEKISDFIKSKHPEKVTASCALALCNDICLTHFRNILKGRKEQNSLDRFLLKRPASQSEEIAAKKANLSEEDDNDD